ncbi:MAG TPA: RnfABCDGE type electron transport complex subunit D, partial [Plasticicumulans sp.]|nr:RnfABCDGE type electron transport complex subunit D [Plasticicumulans sp.]
VVLLISFPLEMSTWAAPRGVGGHVAGFGEALALIFGGHGDHVLLDAVSSATPLDTLHTQLGLGQTVAAVRAGSPVFGWIGGSGWEWANLAFLGGGLWMCQRRVAAWQIPAGMLGALALISTVFWIAEPARFAPPWFHVMSGAAVFGAFFIATDPVSASTTPRGRLIYGAGIGLLTWLIRSLGGFPDGVAFAVLLMNLAAPTIDQYTLPRAFGAGRA